MNQELKAYSKVTYVCASSALKKQLGLGTNGTCRTGGLLSDSLKASASRRQFGRVLRAHTWHETEHSDLGSVACQLWVIDTVPHLSAPPRCPFLQNGRPPFAHIQELCESVMRLERALCLTQRHRMDGRRWLIDKASVTSE